MVVTSPTNLPQFLTQNYRWKFTMCAVYIPPSTFLGVSNTDEHVKGTKDCRFVF